MAELAPLPYEEQELVCIHHKRKKLIVFGQLMKLTHSTWNIVWTLKEIAPMGTDWHPATVLDAALALIVSVDLD